MKNHSSIDFMKFFFAICVVAIHTTPFAFQSAVFQRILQGILSLAVPFFFVTSGFLLFSKIKTSPTQASIKKYERSMFKRLVIWNLIYLPFAISEYHQYQLGFIKGVLFWLKDLFLIGGHQLSGHLWYLLSSFYGIFILALMLKRKCKDWQIATIAIILYIIGQIGDWIIETNILTENIATSKFIHYVDFMLNPSELFTGVFYLTAGYFLVKYKHRILNIQINLIAFVLFFILWLIFPNNYVLFFVTIALFCLIYKSELPNGKIFIWMRRASALIYYSHLWVAFIYTYLFKKTSGLGCFLFVLSVALLFSMGLNYIIDKNPKSRLTNLL